MTRIFIGPGKALTSSCAARAPGVGVIVAVAVGVCVGVAVPVAVGVATGAMVRVGVGVCVGVTGSGGEPGTFVLTKGDTQAEIPCAFLLRTL